MKYIKRLTLVGFLLLVILTLTVWWISYQVGSLPTGNYFPETEEEINESYP